MEMERLGLWSDFNFLEPQKKKNKKKTKWFRLANYQLEVRYGSQKVPEVAGRMCSKLAPE